MDLILVNGCVIESMKKYQQQYKSGKKPKKKNVSESSEVQVYPSPSSRKEAAYRIKIYQEWEDRLGPNGVQENVEKIRAAAQGQAVGFRTYEALEAYQLMKRDFDWLTNV
jgi:L-amino acid N-acyltransferase YncA